MDWFLDHIDFLAPLIFFIIYGISAAAKAGKGNDEEDSGESESSSPSQGRNRRDIHEEIRRRIMERMQEASGQSQQSSTTSQSEPSPASFSEPVRQEENKQPQSFPRASSKPKPAPEPVSAAPFDPMADMQRKIREAQQSAKEAETALQNAGSGVLKPITVARKWGVRESHHGTSFLSRLRADLSTPARQREAIVVSEVLGKPVSLRRSPSGIPPLADR